MGEQGITQEMVVTVLARPGRWFEGDTANEYEAVVKGRRLHVVVSVDPLQGIVITVYWVAL